MSNSKLFSDSLTQDKKSCKSHITTGLGPMTDKFLNNVFSQLDTEKLKTKLTDNFVDSMTDVVNQKIQPYVYVGIALYSVVIMLLCIIIYLVIIKKKI